MMIEGRIPVLEAIYSFKHITKLLILKGARDKNISAIILEASKHSEIQLDFVDRSDLDSISKSGKHQGVIGWMKALEYASVDDILNTAYKKKEDPFIFILDGIEDPHNLGAIIRTALASGSHGVIIRENRAAKLNATVLKASAGAANYLKVAKVPNIARCIDELKKKGLWIFCADMDGKTLYATDLQGPICLVIGNEGKGVSALVQKKCDVKVSIPMYGNVNSLNASVAAAILAYEVIRQRHFKG